MRADHAARVLATGRPRLRARCADPAAAEALLGEVQAVVGAAPWAFVLESDEGAELRVDLPDPAAAERLAAWLLARPAIDAAFDVAEPPGFVEALDRGWLAEEALAEAGIVARHWPGRRADLARPPVRDPVVDAIGARLAARVAPLPVRADGAGPGTPIVHRPSGRPGLELWIGGDPLARREAVLRSLAAEVAEIPELVPALEWEETGGELQVRAWFAAPPGPGLPGDAGADGFDWLGDLPDHAADVEFRVSGPDADALAEAVAPLAEAAGLVGGPPRWLPRDGTSSFVPTWVGPVAPPQLVRALAALPGVAGVALAPGVPYGLEPLWVVLEPAVRTVGGVVWHRLPDPVADRDRLEEVADRVPDPLDERVAAAVPEDVRPIVDTTGRRGLELTGPSAAWEALLASAASMSEPALTRIGTFGFRGARAVARRWFRGTPDPGDRRWV